MRKLIIAAIAVFVVSTVGCATLTEDAMTPIAMSFSDGSNGECKLQNKRGAWMPQLPATISVRKSDDGLKYDCETEDGRKVFGEIPSTMGAKIVASAVFLDFGIVDAITDKHRKYPASFVIPTVSKRVPEINIDSKSKIIVDKQSDEPNADILEANAFSERWVKVGINENDYVFYYDSETLVISDEEIAKVWIKTINKENRYMDLVEIDCIQDKFHMLQEKYASNSVFSEYTQEWKFILPESVPELIHNSLCHKEIAK